MCLFFIIPILIMYALDIEFLLSLGAKIGPIGFFILIVGHYAIYLQFKILNAEDIFIKKMRKQIIKKSIDKKNTKYKTILTIKFVITLVIFIVIGKLTLPNFFNTFTGAEFRFLTILEIIGTISLYFYYKYLYTLGNYNDIFEIEHNMYTLTLKNVDKIKEEKIKKIIEKFYNDNDYSLSMIISETNGKPRLVGHYIHEDKKSKSLMVLDYEFVDHNLTITLFLVYNNQIFYPGKTFYVDKKAEKFRKKEIMKVVALRNEIKEC